MSRGLGRIQRTVVAAFADDPNAKLTISQLALRCYPDQKITEAHLDTVRRTLTKLEPALGLRRCRIGQLKERGWHYVIGR